MEPRRRPAEGPGGTMDRRAALRTLGLGALGAGLLGTAACAPATGPARGAWDPAPPGRRFAPVRVGWDRVIRTVVGLRPYRPGGFVVRAERMGDKVVVHDYGHGGGGVTLSWGTAELAVDEAWATGAREFAVVGCGAVGLATARLLQRRGGRVTVYARELPPHTTSNVAGAQWSPFSVYDPAAATPEFAARFARASRIAFRRFQDLVGAGYGVRWLDNYYVDDQPVRLAPFVRELPDVYPDVEELPPGAHPFPFRHAVRVTTMMIEPHVYLEAMLRDVRLAGAGVEVRELRDLGELLALPEPVIMNCTGLGSRELFGDRELVPVKGQLTVLVPQPEVDYLLLAGGLYMFPRSDGILLGGTFQRGEWSLEPDPEAMRRVVEGHARIFGAAAR